MVNRVQEAIDTIVANDRGGFTVPTSRLYPYQWNWDSAFAAIGFACFDRNRAWQELETLFSAQWDDGMVPHIVFRRDDPDYFPGPQVWQAGGNPPSSGHSQPPVATSIAKQLVQSGNADDLERARALFPAMLRYHRWFHAARDPDNLGLISIMHPWESGRDNCPDWDVGMDRIEVAKDLPPYVRRDTGHVDPSERPTKLQYDRFLTIIKFGRECGWDQLEIYRNGPFLMADPAVHFVLMKGDSDLLELAQTLGFTENTAEIEGWISQYDTGNQLIWNDTVRSFVAREMRTGQLSDGITNASMLALYANAGTDEQRQEMITHLAEILDVCKYGVPSWDPRHPAFEPQRYWRGPAWAMMNYMIAEGLLRNGEANLAERIRTDTIRMIDEAGFYEYFNSMTGEGCGGGDFTWTAAIYLAWTVGLNANESKRGAA